MHGLSGIVPKVRLNFFEVSLLGGGELKKEVVKEEVELTIKKLESKARGKEPVEFNIPHVGTLKI